MYRSAIESYEGLDIENSLVEFVYEAEVKNVTQTTTTNTATNNTNNTKPIEPISNNPTNTKTNDQQEKDNKAPEPKDQEEIKKEREEKSSIIDKIKKIIDVILGIIQNLGRFVTNRLQLILESEKGFKDRLNKQMAIAKPQENVKVLCYQYDEEYIDKTINNLSKLVANCISALEQADKTPANAEIKMILSADTHDDMIKLVFRNFGGRNISNAKEFNKLLQEKYRGGEKQERVYNVSQVNYFIEKNNSSQAVVNFINTKIKECNDSINNLKRLERVSSVGTAEKVANEQVIKNLNKANALYNTYSQIVRNYTELKIESILSARAVLKRFYQMT